MTRFFGITTEPFLFLHSGIFTVNTYCLPQFLLSKLCHNVYNSSVCLSLSTGKYNQQEDHIQQSAANWLKLIPMLSLGLVMVTILFVGSIADMVGKRRAMILCPILTLIQAIIFVVLSRVQGHFNPALLLIPVFIPALFGDAQGALLLGLAYKADITRSSERTKGIAAGEGFFYMSIAFFGLISGLLQKLGGFDAVYSLNIVLSVVSFAYVVLVLSDENSRGDHERDHLLQQRKSNDDNISPAECPRLSNVENREFNFLSLLRMERIRDVLSYRAEGHSVMIYLLLLFLAIVSMMGLAYVGLLYLSHSPFGLKMSSLGYLVSICYLGQAIGALFLVPGLQRFFRMNDYQVIIAGYIGIALFFIAIGVATKTWMLYAAQVLSPIAVMPSPVSRSLLTKHVPDDLHGSVLAVGEFTDALASLVTNFLGNLIYAKSVAYFPGTVMFVYAFIGILGLVITLIFIKVGKQTVSTSDHRE